MPEVSRYTNTQLAQTLRGMAVGERAWFWFCAATGDVETPLMLSPLRDDPMMRTLSAQAELVSLPPQAEVYAGLASLDADGAISLGGAGLSGDALPALAGWVLQNARAIPDLERLRDARFVRVDQGRIVARYEDPELWLGFSAGPQAGSIEAAAATLDAMAPGAIAWVWMTDRGPGRAPFILLAATADDPTGEDFAGAVSAARLRSPDLGETFAGTLHKAVTGKPILSSPSSNAEGAPAILDALAAAHPALGALNKARVFRIKGERRLEISRGPDLSREAAALAGLKGPDDRVGFFFTDGGANHPAVLVLAAAPADLKAAARALPTGEGIRSVRGLVVPSKAGWLEFRAKSEYDGFVGALAQWAAAHAARFPALSRLRGARMTHRDSDDTILSRQKDDAAWDAVSVNA
jgi:hypothetical protein